MYSSVWLETLLLLPISLCNAKATRGFVVSEQMKAVLVCQYLSVVTRHKKRIVDLSVLAIAIRYKIYLVS